MEHQQFKEMVIAFLDKNKTLNIKTNSDFMFFCCKNGFYLTHIVRYRLKKLVKNNILKKEVKGFAEYSFSDWFIENRPILVKKYNLYTSLKVKGKEVVVPNDDPILKIAILQNGDRR